jgi:hypothetical protein
VFAADSGPDSVVSLHRADGSQIGDACNNNWQTLTAAADCVGEDVRALRLRAADRDGRSPGVKKVSAYPAPEDLWT